MWLKASRLMSGCFLVSEKRRQVVVEVVVGGDNVDISYITDRILAMSSPPELKKAIYQNLIIQVKEVLERRHRGHYKVYNLCMDQNYDPSYSNGFVERFPFDDNCTPSLHMVKEFCESVDSWLSSDPKNIVFIHCVGGKGRIGLMVFSYMVYKGMLAEEALRVFADKRTTNNLEMMIPSQRRYANYWQKSLSFLEGCPSTVNLPKPTSRELRRIRLYDTKSIQSIFVVSEMQEVSGRLYRSPADACRNFCRKIQHSYLEIEEDEDDLPNCLDYYFRKTVHVTGDVCVTFYEKNIGGRLFYACFNTDFIENNSLEFSIMELDKVGNKGKLIAGPDFRVELYFGPANPNPDDSVLTDELQSIFYDCFSTDR